MTAPTRKIERSFLAAGHQFVAGMDEVGRGALAGPVSVGVVIVCPETGRMPAGVRDSKLIPADRRKSLVEPVRRWAFSSAVGHASPAEIDRYGIVAGLSLAGHRALVAAAVSVDVVLLDGVHDWLNGAPGVDLPCPTPAVVTQKKGDLRIAAIAAASILAKVERDEIMAAHDADHPQYGWSGNKGYAAPAHTRALREHGPSELHRRSWNLPTGPQPVQASLY